MTCAGNNTVAALLAGAIDATAAHDLEVHLDACASCRQLVADLGRGLSAIGDARGGSGERLPRAGEQVGRYTIKRVVGVGGMGVVYEAHDAALDRRVAVKLLRPDLVDDTQLLVEAQAMARLQHANIAVIHDVGSFRGQLYLCMEYVDGATLRAWLAERSRSWREIVATFAAAGRGLAYVHAAGLVHLDFKPDNVLVSRSELATEVGRRRVVVTDFGLARMVGAHEPRMVMGTPAYMAPEQKRGAATDQRTDQYGFCAALREALGDAGPAWLRRVLARGLAERPVDRYASMAALLAALETPTHRTRRYVAAAIVTAGAALGLAALPGPQTIREVVDHPPIVRVIRQPGAAAEVAAATPDEDGDDDAVATIEPTAASPAAELAEVFGAPAAKVARPVLVAFSEDTEAIAQPAHARRADAPGELGRTGIFGPSCSDGTDRVCAIDQPSCPPTTVAAILDGCWTCADARTCAPLGLPHSCDDGTRVTTATTPTCTGHLVASVHRGSLQCADPFACARPSLPQVPPSKPHGKTSAVCGNFICDTGETQLSCPSDCVTTCGNGFCEAGEDFHSCPSDCCQQQGSGSSGSGSGSGSDGANGGSGANGSNTDPNGPNGANGGGSGGANSCFDAAGNQVSCDTGSGSGNGGNGGSGSGSNNGACVPVCGNNFCEAGEDSVSCPQDCGGGCDPTTNNC